MAELKAVDDFHECAECEYTWISDDPACPACGVFGKPLNPSTAMLVDWAEFWRREQSAEDYLIWPIACTGRGVAIYAPAKDGKSFVVLALVAAMVTGQVGLDGLTREPIDVLYLDYEMTLDDLQERLEEFGYGPTSDLSHLHYASLPSLPPLDSPEGAKAVMELVQATGAKLVIIDTFGRATEGEENSNDTGKNFYRWTGLALKAAKVAFVRTDHTGKDPTKGQRGGSAKNDDVDVVWSLKRIEGGTLLTTTYKRISWIPDKVHLAVTLSDKGTWEFTVDTAQEWPAGTEALAHYLARLGIPEKASFTEANAAIKAVDLEGKGRNKRLVLAAQAWRRGSVDVVICDSVNPKTNTRSVPAFPGTGQVQDKLEPVPGTDPGNGQLPGPEPVLEPAGTGSPDNGEPGSPPIGGTGTSPTSDDAFFEEPF